MKALIPTTTLLTKLGSAIVHAEEMIGKDAHDFDIETFLSLVDDSEVKAWMEEMDDAAPKEAMKFFAQNDLNLMYSSTIKMSVSIMWERFIGANEIF